MHEHTLLERQNSANYEEYADSVCSRTVTQLEDILGYIFRVKKTRIINEIIENESSEDENDDLPVSTPIAFFTKLYRCSQDKSSANYSKYDKTCAVPPPKRRRRISQTRYGCNGRIRIFVPNNADGADIDLHTLGPIHVRHGEILLHFSHKCSHPPRERKPVPQIIRDFIKNPANRCRSASEMYGKVLNAAAGGDFGGSIDMTDITDDNIRYWWSLESKLIYQRDEDAWKSAVAFLQEQLDVPVHSYIHLRRRSFCWYVHKQLDVDLSKVTEVYIDSTHSTNTQNAELFAIIACEDGYGVPLAYMLMEKMPTDDSTLFPGEVTEACTRFFSHAKEVGLYPILIHTDKSAAELAAIKVCIVSEIIV